VTIISKTRYHQFLSPIEVVVEDARNGRMFILVDAEERENEGDLVIPAQMATPDAINFMAKYGRGLICLALTPERAKQLHLELMSRSNRARQTTAFTVSIEAREGVSTGISAHDRAHTISVAIDPTKDYRDIMTPGHVFPLVAKEGGVLIRAGHTEAAVDLARLAGLYAAGVICEIMNDDGTMARLPGLIAFAQRHGLKIATIAALRSPGQGRGREQDREPIWRCFRPQGLLHHRGPCRACCPRQRQCRFGRACARACARGKHDR
jgi:3,4-dihydroxy 2-butanone 4-phosphate synthase / GTP cyclohydrolase II